MKTPCVTLEQWRTLQAVIDHGSFALAAEALERSQSAVSYAIARMQEQLGVSLLRPEGRRAVLTEAGRVLLKRSRLLVRQANLLEELARDLDRGWESELRLVVDTGYPTDSLLRALTEFEGLARGCRLRMREESMSGVKDVLLSNTADLAICALPVSGYLGFDLGKVNLCAVAHHSHPLHQLRRALTLEDLETSLQVMVRDSGASHLRDLGWMSEEYIWSVNSYNMALQLVARGLGFSWLPESLFETYREELQLQLLPLEPISSKALRFTLYTRKDKSLGPAAQLLCALIRNANQSDVHVGIDATPPR